MSFLDQQKFIGLWIGFNLVSKLIHLRKGTTLKCSYYDLLWLFERGYPFINHLCLVATCMSCGLNWPGLQSCVAKIRPKGSSHKHRLCGCFEVVKGVTGVFLFACMSKTHFLLCSVSSAWMCTLKQHQRARTPLRMRMTKMRRRRSWRSWRSSRRQSTTSLQIKRIWKRWWTGADAALPHHSRLFSVFGLKDLRSPSLVFITLLPSSLKPSHLSQAVWCCVDLHGQWNGITHSQCASVLRS